jgi:Thioredoxin
MRRYLPFTIVAAVALLTLGSATMLYRAKRPRGLTISKEITIQNKRHQSIHVRGNSDAAVTLEEFGDFQCPPCGALAGPIDQLAHDYHPRLRVIFHHFPLITHQHAREAAWARKQRACKPAFGDA